MEPKFRQPAAKSQKRGTISGVQINERFVLGDPSQTQKYKPIEVSCQVDGNAQAILLECMQQRVLAESTARLLYRTHGFLAEFSKRDPVVFMTGGRLAHICEILLHYKVSEAYLAFHPQHHDRSVFIFVQDEIFDAALALLKTSKVWKLFTNGLFLVGWRVQYDANVKFGFGAMRRAVMTYFQRETMPFDGFWLVDDDTLPLPASFDAAEELAERAAKPPYVIGFTQGATRREELHTAETSYLKHKKMLELHAPSLSNPVAEPVLQQAVKYCGIKLDLVPPFHQGFICSGEDVSFQRFLSATAVKKKSYEMAGVPIVWVGGSIHKVDLQNQCILQDHAVPCMKLNAALRVLFSTQNAHRRRLVESEAPLLAQITCELAQSKLSLVDLAGVIFAECEKHGNALKRTAGDIQFLLVELLFCWTKPLRSNIPKPNTLSAASKEQEAEERIVRFFHAPAYKYRQPDELAWPPNSGEAREAFELLNRLRASGAHDIVERILQLSLQSL